MNGKLSSARAGCCVCVHFILFDARRNPLRYSGGGICLRFAVFGYFLRGYLRFRGFWAIFLRFAVCGLRFLASLSAVLRFRSNFLLRFRGFWPIFLRFCGFSNPYNPPPRSRGGGQDVFMFTLVKMGGGLAILKVIYK